MAGFTILYLVHDVFDPAVARRAAMLRDGGATVMIAGFRRENSAMPDTIDFGLTQNGKFLQRIAAVLKQVILLRRHRQVFAKADVILARNLEMLAIGARGRSLCDNKSVLVYECLDIHRLMLNQGVVGKILRRLEGWLARKASALIVSSPAFVENYFEKQSHVRLPIRLVENKLYTVGNVVRQARTAGPPWRIGWFGALRCKESLEVLADLARHSQGKVEVVLRGRPAYDQMPDFEKITTQTPGIKFLGAYKNPDDLVAIYNDVHFTWAIDRFEAGQNSSWLLPNRLYEGGAYASVPIAEKAVETGSFLDRLSIGVMLDHPLKEKLKEFFGALTADKYRSLEMACTSVPLQTWVCDQDECVSLVQFLQDLR